MEDLALMGVREEVGIGAVRARASRAAVCGEEEEGSGEAAARARRVRAMGRREVGRIVVRLFCLVLFGFVWFGLVEGGREGRYFCSGNGSGYLDVVVVVIFWMAVADVCT